VLGRRRPDDAPPRPRRRIRKLRLLLLLCILGISGLAAFSFGIVLSISQQLPSLDPANAESKVESKQNGYIYASDGKTVLAVLRGDEARIVVPSDRIAPIMKQAIVAVEDRRFYEHRGVDLRGIIRAVWADLRHKEVVQGGSTITQQFVKNTYIKPEKTVSRKLKEAALAWQLERKWSKDRILTAYLNTIYFGNNAYGIEMAAQVYFHKHARDLTLPEAALLAGIPENPSANDPVSNPTQAKERRDTVLALMFGQGLITRQQYESARHAPMPNPETIGLPGTRGPAQYFAEYVKSQLIPYYGSGKVFGGGLKVYTSIDLGLQKIAREAIDKWLPDPHGPEAALVAIDPRDGRVLAMIGGRSFSKLQFNLATQGERQPGSAFKPFVLATALADGVSPDTVFPSKPVTIRLDDGRIWAVHNYENEYLGSASLTTATIVSDNTVYAQLTSKVGPSRVAAMAHRLGIRSPLNDYFGIGLGVEAVNPLEMARAYSTFADGGARVDGSLLGNEPRAVLAVKDGNRVDYNEPVKRQALPGNDAAILTSILERVVTEGTGKRAELGDRPVAGKTGTTENYGDAWFVGYTPQLAVAVWVGYPRNLQFMTNQFYGSPVAGGTYPALIFRAFMKSALPYLHDEPESFPEPSYQYSVSVRVTLRNGRFERDNGLCSNAATLAFFADQAPQVTADCKRDERPVPKLIDLPVLEAQARLKADLLDGDPLYRPARVGERHCVVLDQNPEPGVLVGPTEQVQLYAAKSEGEEC
jgi:penicillin-binding protein 1A